MNIGIVIAITRELRAFLESDFKTEVIKKGNKDIYTFEVGKNHVYALQSGFGLIDSAAATQLLISVYDCEVILNYGVTGALDRALKVSDLFLVKGACNTGFDVSAADGVPPYKYEEFENIFIPFDCGLIEKVRQINPELKEVYAASGDRFIADRSEKLRLHSELGCSICDMESAAIARISYLNGVKALSIKCISDEFDGDGSDFNKNVTVSAAKAFKVIKEFLLSL